MVKQENEYKRSEKQMTQQSEMASLIKEAVDNLNKMIAEATNNGLRAEINVSHIRTMKDQFPTPQLRIDLSLPL